MKAFFALLLTAFVAGCQTTPPLYYWGHYEPLTYAALVKPEKATPEMQIRLLRQDEQVAAAKHLALPPGFHAYLGAVLYKAGDHDGARSEFEMEKSLFPESTAFVDQLLKGDDAKIK